MHHIAILGMLAAVGTGSGSAEPAKDSCPVTALVTAQAPRDPSADSVIGTWYMNDDRTIWVMAPEGGWPARGKTFSGNRPVPGQKTYWVRPAGTNLVVSDRRLDADAAPVEAYVPCCYPTGFQIVSLHFPTEGCWEVRAKAGSSDLRFVTLVTPPRK